MRKTKTRLHTLRSSLVSFLEALKSPFSLFCDPFNLSDVGFMVALFGHFEVQQTTVVSNQSND